MCLCIISGPDCFRTSRVCSRGDTQRANFKKCVDSASMPYVPLFEYTSCETNCHLIKGKFYCKSFVILARSVDVSEKLSVSDVFHYFCKSYTF